MMMNPILILIKLDEENEASVSRTIFDFVILMGLKVNPYSAVYLAKVMAFVKDF